jgi:hypothetical protein
MDLNTFTDHNIKDVNMVIEKEVVIKKNFDHTKKLELVKKISKIKKKEYLINIFKIIKTHSEDYNVNNNGVFVFFHNLPDEVYEQIDIYVNNIYKLHKKSAGVLNSIYYSDLSDSQFIGSDTIEIENEKQLSNKEKLIRRRKKYEQYLNQNQDQNI